MENFPHLVNISIESKINQSEEINKVKHAITNLINIELKHENGKIIGINGKMNRQCIPNIQYGNHRN
mgnify:CR=1 FL=1